MSADPAPSATGNVPTLSRDELFQIAHEAAQEARQAEPPIPVILPPVPLPLLSS